MVSLAENNEPMGIARKQPYYPSVTVPAEAVGKLANAKDGEKGFVVFEILKRGSSLVRSTKKSQIHIELLRGMPYDAAVKQYKK